MTMKMNRIPTRILEPIIPAERSYLYGSLVRVGHVECHRFLRVWGGWGNLKFLEEGFEWRFW